MRAAHLRSCAANYSLSIPETTVLKQEVSQWPTQTGLVRNTQDKYNNFIIRHPTLSTTLLIDKYFNMHTSISIICLFAPLFMTLLKHSCRREIVYNLSYSHFSIHFKVSNTAFTIVYVNLYLNYVHY